MKLPNGEKATVPPPKVVDYLLSTTHTQGRHKAAFFRSFGFAVDSPETLVAALRRHGAGHDVFAVEDTAFGKRYIVEGGMPAPDGRAPVVRSVWFLEENESVPRFVTAFPAKRKQR